MMVAHIAGVPVEEWLIPVAATGGSIVVGLRVAFRRLHHRNWQSTRERSLR